MGIADSSLRLLQGRRKTPNGESSLDSVGTPLTTVSPAGSREGLEADPFLGEYEDRYLAGRSYPLNSFLTPPAEFAL